MTKVFSVRISESLFNKIIKEIEDQGSTRKEWFISRYNENKSLRKPVYATVYKQQDSNEYNLLCKALDSLPKRYNRFLVDSDETEVF